MIVIAHISDLHVNGTEAKAERTRRVMAYLDALEGPIDVVLATGDLVDDATPEEYAELLGLLKTRHRLIVGPGNHDAREPFRAAFGLEGDGPIDEVHVLDGLLVVALDSSIPGQHDGWIADESLAFLHQQLAQHPDLPAVVAFHHPPLDLHCWVDRLRQTGEERLAAVVQSHPSVVALVCGHAHTAAATTFAGLPLLVAPGVSSTVVLPWEPPGIVDEEQPPGVAFHVIGDDRRVTTHFRAIA